MVEDLRERGRFLAKRLEGYQYAIRGTASLVLQGLKMGVQDIDLVGDKEMALAANKILAEYLVEAVDYKESEKFRSYFGKFEIEGVRVEIMGEWEIKDKKGVWQGPYTGDRCQVIVIGGKEIKVTTIEEELKVSAIMGRWNEYWKIKKQVTSNKKPWPGRQDTNRQEEQEKLF